MANEKSPSTDHHSWDRASEAMVLADDQGVYVAANAAAGELFGLPAELLVGRRIAEFAQHGYDAAGAFQRFRAEGVERGEFNLIRSDGTVPEGSAKLVDGGREWFGSSRWHS